MTIAQNTNAPLGSGYACQRCKDTGLTYEGNGHRMTGYPYAEKGVMVSCSCAAGKRLDEQDAGAIDRERAAQAEADRTPIIELARRMAATTPAGTMAAPNTHGAVRRGTDYGDRIARMHQDFNDEPDEPWLSSRQCMVLIVLLAIIAGSIIAYTTQASWLDPKLIY